MSWLPTGALIYQSETAINVSETASYTPLENERVVSYDYSLSSNWKDRLVVTTDNLGVTVKASSLAGLVTPNYIKAKDMTANKLLSFASWEVMPEGLEIVDFSPASAMLVMQIHITANVIFVDPATSEEIARTYNQSFDINIAPNWSAGRELLKNYRSWSVIQKGVI
ncbi:hypothetical protein [Vibrio sonorensis]|uniref:hypothetical protein n=1 Tax=Vibrio sonorensis TaxID=1004316 RepID=UPI0008DA4AF6|nr:hypothetical protein [Vibrio sonorensis]